MARNEGRNQALQTSREEHGYDGMHGAYKWWFEAWGSGPKEEWRIRGDVGRPPTPRELVRADYIVFGFQKGTLIIYKTHTGGLDLRRLRK